MCHHYTLLYDKIINLAVFMHIHKTTKLRLKMSNSVGYYQMSHIQQILRVKETRETPDSIIIFSSKGSINSCLGL